MEFEPGPELSVSNDTQSQGAIILLCGPLFPESARYIAFDDDTSSGESVAESSITGVSWLWVVVR
jgi:hypothetical protein